MGSKLKSNRGLTIVEFLIAVSILGFVATLVAALYFANFKLFSNQNTAIDISSQNKLALADITNQIRESQSAAASCCGETTSDTVLVLQLWPLDASGELTEPTGGYDYVVYKRDLADNTKLTKQVVPDNTSTREAKSVILSTTVSALTFNYDNADPTLSSEITVDLTNTQNSYGKTHSISQSASAVLRNK